jgi:hypothetical protein
MGSDEKASSDPIMAYIMRPTMKNLWILLLLCLALSDCKDKAVDPAAYDGDYPYYRNGGGQIRTYPIRFENTGSTTGAYQVSFNNHDWNHWLYVIAGGGWSARSASTFGFGMLAVEGVDCNRESFNFSVPAKVGMHRYGKEVAYASQFPENPYFSLINCDAGSDNTVLADQTANNWVNITRFDSLSRPNEAEGSFDITFKIVQKNPNYVLVYPNTIRMRGSFKQRFKER